MRAARDQTAPRVGATGVMFLRYCMHICVYYMQKTIRTSTLRDRFTGLDWRAKTNTILFSSCSVQTCANSTETTEFSMCSSMFNSRCGSRLSSRLSSRAYEEP